MKQTTFLFIAFAFPLFSFAQQVTYNDVAVVVNDNSQTSIDIGNYFALQRNIPSQNIIHITAPVQEEIDTTQLFNLLTQARDYLTTNNLADSINYIVTTKGVPLKVANGNCMIGSGCSSVEFEMALMLCPLSGAIAKGGDIYNSYFQSQEHFNRSTYNIFLVTRLDGYSYDDVIKLIDNSGPNIPVIKNEALFVLDISHTDSSIASAFQIEANLLTQMGWNYVYDGDTAALLNQSNVLGLLSVDHNSAGQNLNYNWLRGSIAQFNYCYTASTFDESQNPADNFLVADAVKEGATGMNGYVYCVYANTTLIYSILLSRYLDMVNHFNLAESYYMASPGLSYPHLIIGDPKTSIVLDTLNGISSIPNAEIKLYPNPSTGVFLVSFPSVQNCDVSVSDVFGNILWEEQWDASNKIHSLDLQSQPAGIYVLKVSAKTPLEKQGSEAYVLKLVKQ